MAKTHVVPGNTDKAKILKAWILLTTNPMIAARVDPTDPAALGAVADKMGILAADPLRDRVVDLIKWSRDTQSGSAGTILDSFTRMQTQFQSRFTGDESAIWPVGDPTDPHPGVAELNQILGL
jgi:hypothetical protein